MPEIRLIALDLDGTLFNDQGIISEANRKAIREATAQGIEVVVSTGRPLCGLPMDQIGRTPIRYAITTNGSGVYEIATGKCLFEDGMDPSVTGPILSYLTGKDIYIDAFIGGKAYSTHKDKAQGDRLTLPPSLRSYVLNTRTRVDDLMAYILENKLSVQKFTLNFFSDGNGGHIDREEVHDYLMRCPQITCVCGGYFNLEFTRAGVDKGIGLMRLSEALGVDPAQTMAVGDTENDIAIVKAAALGVAMGNATADVIAAADVITDTNEADGVAKAIRRYALRQKTAP